PWVVNNSEEASKISSRAVLPRRRGLFLRGRPTAPAIKPIPPYIKHIQIYDIKAQLGANLDFARWIFPANPVVVASGAQRLLQRSVQRGGMQHHRPCGPVREDCLTWCC